jgi:hypothetical protein
VIAVVIGLQLGAIAGALSHRTDPSNFAWGVLAGVAFANLIHLDWRRA